MAQIFISHSARDQNLKNFFNQAFATSSVEAIYEEIEQLVTQAVTTEKVERDITQSSAVFVLLSQTVESLSHTRDWVGFEVGYAKGASGSGGNKDVWVFENIDDGGQLRMMLPSFDHYVVYHTSDAVLPYLKQIVESYDDNRVLKNAALATGGGYLLGFPWIGIPVLLYSALVTGRPPGVEVICQNQRCLLKYKIHLPQFLPSYRCAKCNQWWPNPQVVPQNVY
jgi:hypothetical protein